MNATFILFSAVCMAGADPAPAAAAAPAPAVVAAAPGCGGCGAPAPSCSTCDSPCSHHVGLGLFSKLKARLSSLKPSFGCSSHCAPACSAPCAPAPVACAPAPVACAPAPVACAPAPAACAPTCGTPLISKAIFTGFTTSACGCGSSKLGLFDRLKAKFHHSSACESCASPCGASPCSTGPAMVAPATPVAPPKEMPAPPKEEPKKETPKTTALAPVVPLTAADSVRIPELTGTAGKY